MAKSTPSVWQALTAGGADERGRWQLADHLGDMISAHAPDGTYRYASAAAHRLLGFEPAELVGTDAYAYFHPEDAAKVATAHRSALAGRPLVVTYRLRRKDGTYIWVETTTTVVTDDDGSVVTELVACTRAIDAREAGIELGDGDHAAELERIERILATGEIVPVFQPIYELGTMRVVAFEALARFPGDPAYTPDRWFADAWRVGLGVPLELQAAKRATAAFARLGARATLFVNASPPVVAAPGFLQLIGDVGGHVTVEVTEHLKIDDYDQLGLELAAFRDAGGQLAIDDFGAGFASFRHILELRPQWIKLDGALIRQLETSEFARGLANAVVSFARDAEIEVIAEGIETETELEHVTALGIRHGQGFLLSEPLSLEEALALAES